VIERMEEFEKAKVNKLERRKRDLTPKFKPQVLENYNSGRKLSKSRKKAAKSKNRKLKESEKKESADMKNGRLNICMFGYNCFMLINIKI
jgi:hypothetical protein